MFELPKGIELPPEGLEGIREILTLATEDREATLLVSKSQWNVRTKIGGEDLVGKKISTAVVTVVSAPKLSGICQLGIAHSFMSFLKKHDAAEGAVIMFLVADGLMIT